MADLLAAPVVMGVLNVTPDSFSDGGRYADLDAAVAHAVAMRADGAHVVDIGGESTRPGAGRIDADTERARVLPVIRELAAAGVRMSIDTTRASVASAALEAGAWMVNDVSGGLADPDMARVVADAGCPWVLMHWRGHSRGMAQLARYDDVVAEVVAELSDRVAAALNAGVRPEKIIIDPGLGFAKRAEHNWALSAGLPALVALGYPVLFAASRKSYLGALLAAADGTPRPTGQREAATLATSVLAVAAGAWGVRVHDVRGTADALAVWRATGGPVMVTPPGPAVITSPGGPAVITSPGGLGVVAPPGSVAPASPDRPEAVELPRSAAVTPPDGPAGVAGPERTVTRSRDRISLAGLRVRGRHGVYDFEREQGQDFVIDVHLGLDLAPAAASDDVADTVHYGDLAERLAGIVAGEPVRLIETLAERLVDACLSDARVAEATVTVHKPQAPISLEFADVAVTVRRARHAVPPAGSVVAPASPAGTGAAPSAGRAVPPGGSGAVPPTGAGPAGGHR